MSISMAMPAAANPGAALAPMHRAKAQALAVVFMAILLQ
jgi:hypothetical protein